MTLPTILEREAQTRAVPIGLDECAYARNRPAAERCPYPQPGWEVYYRRHEWALDDALVLMRVVEVQDPDDRDSDWVQNIREIVRSPLGQPLYGPTGQPVWAPSPDPWPWVRLRYEGEIPKGTDVAWQGRLQQTCEARVRGSAGWLPLDYRTRRVLHLTGQLELERLATPAQRIATDKEPAPWPQSR